MEFRVWMGYLGGSLEICFVLSCCLVLPGSFAFGEEARTFLRLIYILSVVISGLSLTEDTFFLLIATDLRILEQLSSYTCHSTSGS